MKHEIKKLKLFFINPPLQKLLGVRVVTERWDNSYSKPNPTPGSETTLGKTHLL